MKHTLIKLISTGTSHELEDTVNDWLEEHTDLVITDIKYNKIITQGFDENGDGAISSHSALIIYIFDDQENKLAKHYK